MARLPPGRRLTVDRILRPDAGFEELAEACADTVLADAACTFRQIIEAADGVITEIHCVPSGPVPGTEVRPGGGEVIFVTVDFDGVGEMDWGDGAVEVVIRRPTRTAAPRLVLDFADPRFRAMTGR
jgi:hypothetical protein